MLVVKARVIGEINFRLNLMKHEDVNSRFEIIPLLGLNVFLI